jgi:hypothetical protein
MVYSQSCASLSPLHILPLLHLRFPSSGFAVDSSLSAIFQAAVMIYIYIYGKGKVLPLQAWSGPEGASKLRFPGFMTTAQDGGKFVSLTHRPPFPPGN